MTTPISTTARLLWVRSRHSATVSTRSMANIGFIGVGNMGKHMAKHLADKGHSVSVYDVNAESMTPLKKFGARLCSSPGDAASQAEMVITMLPNNKIVQDAYQGNDGIFKSAKKGTLFMDSSTIDPNLAKSLSEAATKEGFDFLDTPVSGGVVGAQHATLTFMVGGPDKRIPEIEPVLLTMGRRVVHCGGPGMGQAAKMANNMLLAITMIGVAEAMSLGTNLGLEKKTLMGIINTSTGRCWSSEVNNPVPGTMEGVPSANNYEGGFVTSLITKDLGIAQDLATRSGTPTPLGSMSHQIYRTMVNHGLGSKDFSVVYKFLNEQAAISTKK